MNVVLWILQIFAALAFLASGAAKLFVPREQAIKRMDWVNKVPQGIVRLIGLAEVLGGLGLIIPWATQTQPMLTPIAAICLGVIMVGAIITHIQLKENNRSVPSVVLLIIVCIIAAGRFNGWA